MRMLLLLTFVALGTAGEATTPIPGTDWNIAAPTGWTMQTPLGAALVLRSLANVPAGEEAAAAAARERSRGAIAIATQPIAASQTPALFAQQCRGDVERLTSDFIVVEPAAPVTIGGREWQRLRCRFNTGQLGWEQLVCVTTTGALGICITCSSDREHFADWLPAFDAALNSLVQRPAPGK